MKKYFCKGSVKEPYYFKVCSKSIKTEAVFTKI